MRSDPVRMWRVGGRARWASHTLQGLGPIPLAVLAPLWARASETKRRSPILTDWYAVSTAASLDFDFEELHLSRTTSVAACARTVLIDEIVRKCCQADPRLMLVNIGEGLDNRFGRVDNGVMSCLDLDLPEVIALRAKFAPETRRRRLISKNVLDYSWMNEVGPEFETVVLVAEGVLMYLPADDVRMLFVRAAERFRGAEIVFDSLTPAMARFGPRIETGRSFGARYQWTLRHAGQIEEWGMEFKLMERRSFFQSHISHFGTWVRVFTWLVPEASWSHSINRVRLGR